MLPIRRIDDWSRTGGPPTMTAALARVLNGFANVEGGHRFFFWTFLDELRQYEALTIYIYIYIIISEFITVKIMCYRWRDVHWNWKHGTARSNFKQMHFIIEVTYEWLILTVAACCRQETKGEEKRFEIPRSTLSVSTHYWEAFPVTNRMAFSLVKRIGVTSLTCFCSNCQ